MRRAPTGELADWVESLWVHDRPPLPYVDEWLLPQAGADLVVPLSEDRIWRWLPGDVDAPTALLGGVFQGPHEQPWRRATGGALHVAGVHFRPGGAVAVLGAVAAEGIGRCLPLAGWRDGAFVAWRDALRAAPDDDARLDLLEARLNACWTGTRLREPPPDPRVADALRAFAAGAARVGPVQRASGMSPAAFSRAVRRLVGLPPRTLLRLQRLSDAVAAVAAGEPAAAVAGAAGLSDQAHLHDEFRRWLDLTPRQVQAAGPSPRGHLPRKSRQDRPRRAR